MIRIFLTDNVHLSFNFGYVQVVRHTTAVPLSNRRQCLSRAPYHCGPLSKWRQHHQAFRLPVSLKPGSRHVPNVIAIVLTMLPLRSEERRNPL